MLVRSLFSSERNKIWSTIRWHSVERRVLRVQHLISIAGKEGDWRIVRYFQKLLVRSSCSRLKSVRQVTEESRLRFIHGSDGEVILSPRKKLWTASTLMSPYNFNRLRCVQFFTNDGLSRSSLIPTISDRIDQFLWNLALIPLFEVVDKSFFYVWSQSLNTENFFLQIKNCLAVFPNLAWVSTLCLDSFQASISSSWILRNIPMDKHLCMLWQKNNFLVLS